MGHQRSPAFGTAFRVGPHADLLTAQHVAANARIQREKLGPQTQAKIQVSFEATAPEPGSDADGSLSVEVAITAEERAADLALLRIVEPPPEGSSGSGGGGVRSGRLIDPVALARSLGRSESLPGWLDALLRDDAALLADVETRLGNSGAPIDLAESGEIIALCSAILLRDSLTQGELIPLPKLPGAPITVILAAQRIQRFLDAHPVSARWLRSDHAGRDAVARLRIRLRRSRGSAQGPDQRSGRKNSRISRTSASGFSSAGKCPPRWVRV